MKVVADLHFHSKYSRAVSPQMVLPEIAKWAKLKGIDLVTTADFTHPLWFRELRAGLVEAGEGVYRLGKVGDLGEIREGPLFLLTTEIASIFNQGGKLRRIHTLVFAPDFPTAEKINSELAKRGVKLFADGRPMTGLSVKELAELALSVSPDCLVVPAHLWTPWFGTLGDLGGFNSLEEAYGDLAKNIYAIETGHSSSPAMNWRVSELDSRAILSFSDGHSLSKMGREAMVFEIEDIKKLRYEDIKRAIVGKWEVGSGKCDTEVGKTDILKKGDVSANSRNQNFSLQNQEPLTSHFSPHISYTIEFYPEEGKYHYTGHQKCQVRQSPQQTKKLGETCPVCGKHLTVGVMQRVEELAAD